jgi:hypothetical protein
MRALGMSSAKLPPAAIFDGYVLAPPSPPRSPVDDGTFDGPDDRF